MRKHTKQLLALILALCTLVSVAMPTVFAAGESEEPVVQQPADLTVNFATAFENAGVATGAYMQNSAALLNAAYETNQWTLYCGGTTDSIRPNNQYAGGRNRGGFLEIRNNKIADYGATATVPTQFKAPGSGDYTLTISYDMASQSDRTGAELGAYILEMPATHYNKYGIPSPNASSVLVKASQTEPGKSGSVTSTGTVTLKEGKEYILVFYVVSPDTTDCYANFKSFSLNYVPRDTEPPEDLTVNFATAFENAGVAVSAYMQNSAALLNAAYETNQWTLYCGGTTDSIRPNNQYAGGRNRAGFLEVRNNKIADYGATATVPTQFKAPGTGEYRLSVSYGTAYSGDKKGAELGAYILEMPTTHYTKYTVPMPNDARILTKVSQENPGAEGTLTAENTVVLRRGAEYILVFYVISPDETNCYADFSGFSLTFEKALPESTEPTDATEATEATEATVPEETEPVEIPTGPAALDVNFSQDFATAGFAKNTYLQSTTAWQTINNGYPNTYKWAFLLDSNNKHVNSSYPGRTFSDALLYQMQTNAGIAKEYTAFKFTAPGTGYYSLAVNFANSPSSTDASHFSAYILPMANYTKDNIGAVCTAPHLTVNKGFQGVYYGSTTASLTAGTEYILVFCISGTAKGERLELSGFSLYQRDEEKQPEIVVPDGPGYTEGTYDFFMGAAAGANLNLGKETLAAWYEADSINWKYETKHASLNLEQAIYDQTMQSMYANSGALWWLALRIKAPAEDGQYSIQMTHGAKGNGAASGAIYVIPGNTATSDIEKAFTKAGPKMNTDWFYGEKSSDKIAGRTSTTGTVNLKGGEEYIVIFQSLEKSGLPDVNSGAFMAGQIQLTRIGEYVEENLDNEKNDLLYEFYDWDNPSNYLNHYRTEAELKKLIVTKKIDAEYAAGERNWTYQASNGFGQFNPGIPYLNVTVGEKQYYCLKIKSPGTGTYELTYTHYAINNAKAGLRGSVYILPYEEGMTYDAIRGEADFADAVISTSYKAEKTTKQMLVGEYTAFQEGKEYLLCFSVEDDNNAKNSSLQCYPVSIEMQRTGEYAPVSGDGAANGIVYKLPVKDLIGKRHDEATPIMAQRYANGTSNWKLESGSGSAQFNAKYLQFGTSKKGGYWAIRIKSPGTGMYKVTLNNMLGTAINAATKCEMYIFEAPENTIAGGSLGDYAGVNMPITDFGATTTGTRFVKASQSGEYGFVEGKEYIVAFYGIDSADTRNETNSTYFYIDSLVMKRTGDYTEPVKAMSEGGIIAKNVVTEFRVGTQMVVTMNDRDYLVLCVYGGNMMIYDLTEWRLVDEVDFSSVTDTPRTICVDDAGNWWLTGASQSLFRYNPNTREGFNTGKVTGGGNNFEMVTGDDGYLYFGAYVSTGLAIYKYDPVKLTHEHWIPESWAKYPGAVKQKGDYIYTAVSGDGSRYEIWKMNKYTGKIVDRTDISHMMNGERYVTFMSWMGDDYLAAVTPKGWTFVNIHTMEMVDQEKVGLRGYLSRVTSDVIDGKSYFVSTVEGLCYFDVETEEFGVVGGELVNFKTGLRSQCYASIEDTRLTEKSLITFGGMSADGLNIKAINLEAKTSAELIGLVEPGMGEGMNAHSIFKGAPGSNEIIYGPMYPDYPARVYNTETGELLREFMTAGQNDSYIYYQGKMYFGNYTGANLTRMDDGQATRLFTLNDENFHQSRIHSLSAGDNKIFACTIPSNFDLGGVIAWYDMDTELTYVVTGPNPEDVYYGKSSQFSSALTKWYRASNDEYIEDMSKEWDKDLDGDGVNKYFQGPIPLQSIIKVAYSDGLLYGYSCRRPGTGYAEPTHLSAQIFVYDVENMKMLKTVDLRDYLDGLPADPVRYISTLEVDPDISNKCWGVICETLFSMTYDRDTNKIDIKQELSYGLGITSQTESIPQDMTIIGDYMYILFGAKGGLRKINRYDISDNTLIMGDFQRTSQVPSSFVIGDDGDIYYISTSSPHIYVFNVEVTEEELAAAQAVQDIIDALPENVTISDRDQIFAAREAWDEMDPANQPFVNNYDKLVNAEVALLDVRVDSLGEITLEDEAELVSIRKTYTSLERAQRGKIDLMKISEAESQMSILRGERTTNMIDSIGEVSLAKEQLIRDTRASYMALTRYERTLVKNVDVLNAAEAVLTGLILQRNEANAVDKLIEKIGFVFFGDGAKITEARKAYDKLADDTKEMVQKYGTLVAAEIILVVEYVIAVAALVGGALYAIPTTRAKIFKKKEKAESTEE